MKNNASLNTRVQLGTAYFGLAITLSMATTACEQPTPKCTIARGAFAAKYTPVSGAGDCAALVGEVLSIQAYTAQTSASDKSPDFNSTSVAIQPGSITDTLWALPPGIEPNSADQPYAIGKFATSEPNSDGFCIAPKLTVARLRVPEIPEQDVDGGVTPPQPATDVSYEWSNVRVYDTAAATGTQFAADLTFKQDGCTATYKVAAVYPAVACMSDADCAPTASLADGRPFGSGINPDFAVRCDADLGMCVLKKAPPSLR